MKSKITIKFTNLFEIVFKNWDNEKNKKALWFRFYTLIFFVVFIFSFSAFLFNGKTLILPYDGRDQMFPWLAYTGNWIRRIVVNVLHGNFTIPFYDLSIGWGDDIIGFLASGGQLDPLTVIFSAIVPTEYTEYLYIFLVYFRLYLAGLAFLYMCKYFKRESLHSLIGCLVYLFCGYTIYCAPSFTYYTNPMILLPLLIVGTDKIVNKKKAYGFILSVFLSVLCGFYHLYMLTIMVIVYGLVKINCKYPLKGRLKNSISTILRGMGLYLLGVALAAPILLPSICEFLSAGRNGYITFTVSKDVWLHIKYFVIRILTLAAPIIEHENEWGLNFPAFAAIFIIAVVILYCSKGRKELKWITGISLFTLFSPIGGWIMNGFQYICNRWSFGLALVAGCVVTAVLPELFKKGNKVKYYIAIIALYVLLPALSTEIRQAVFFEYGLLFLVVTVIVLEWPFGELSCLSPSHELRIRKLLCLVVVCVNVCVYMVNMGGPHYVSSGVSFIGQETSQLSESAEAQASEIVKDQGMDGRIDSSAFHYHDSMFFGIPGTLLYSSTENGYVLEYWREMEQCCNAQNFKIHSSDQRSYFNTLMSVKYQIEQQKNEVYVPYGYSKTGVTSNGMNIYENDFALPWGYTYENSVSYDNLQNLNGIEKQEILSQAVALSDGSMDVSEFSSEAVKIPYTLEYTNAKWEDGILTTSEGLVRIRLNADLKAGKEYYVRLKGFDIDGYGDEYLTVTPYASFEICAISNGMLKTGRAEAKEYPWYFGRENYLFCIGYSDEDRNSATISVTAKGKFKLEDIELYALPMDSYPERIDALRAEPLENIEFTANQISGTVDLSKDKILCLTVPYGKGWTAYVDGEKTEILRANYTFMGLDLSEGHHDIVFKYCSPGIKLGCVLFVAGLGITIALIVVDRKKRKQSETV